MKFYKILPEGFVEITSYGMIGKVAPLHKYPKGYHTKPRLLLPYIDLAARKNFIAVYYLGIYSGVSHMCSLVIFVVKFQLKNGSGFMKKKL